MAKQYVFLLAVVVLLAGGLFAVDTQVPLGVAVWLPYVVVVLISLWFPVRSQTFLTAAACTVLTLAGLFVSEAGGGPFWIAAVNRLIGILAIWIAAWVGLAARRTVELEEAYRRLKRESEEREKLQEQFLRTQRLESVGVLASGIAHDFNNLLTPILMAAKLLREDRSEEERQHLLSTLQASAERGAEMVRQILAFAGGTDASRSVLRPKLIIQEIKSILEHTIPKSIVVEVSVEDELAPVSGDSTQILQVLMNLCINARDAMPAGGRLTIQAKNVAIGEQQARIHPDARTGRYLSVSVADTGSGIPKEVADRVFDPFFTTKAPGSGTGLGLSTALGIVRSHGGFITIHSETGRGSVFSVFLPAIEEGAAAPAGTQTQEPTNGNGE